MMLLFWLMNRNGEMISQKYIQIENDKNAVKFVVEFYSEIGYTMSNK